MATQLKVTKVRSDIGQNKRKRETLRGLGLKHINQTVNLQKTPEILGMIRSVSHLVVWEEVDNG